MQNHSDTDSKGRKHSGKQDAIDGLHISLLKSKLISEQENYPNYPLFKLMLINPSKSPNVTATEESSMGGH